MSKKSNLEMDALTRALIDRFRTLTGTESTHILMAAGTTRLGKIEFIHNPTWATKSARPLPYIEESILIRIRQNRYSSAGIIESHVTESESKVRIHIEHQSRYAQAIQIPFRAKRPRFFTLGKPSRRDASLRWFGNPHDRRPWALSKPYEAGDFCFSSFAGSSPPTDPRKSSFSWFSKKN